MKPRSPSTWSFLSEREKAIACARVLADSSVTVNERLNIRDAFRPFKDWRYGIWALISFSFGVPLVSVNNFLPQIVASLGYSTIRTNLLTVAPNIVGTVALLILTFSSDYFRERSIHMLVNKSTESFWVVEISFRCIPLATTLIGFIILGSINVLEHRHVAYFACFLLTMGVSSNNIACQLSPLTCRREAYAPSVLVASWYSNNTPSESRRAVVAAVMSL